MKLKTVKIKHGDSYCVINESDFKEGEHELYEEMSDPPESDPPESDPPESNSGKIDLNSATSEQLKSLPSIGVKSAKAIEDGKPYKSLADAKSRLDVNWEAIGSLVEVK